MKLQNVMKTIDINATDINIATWYYLNNFHIAYRDEVLKEHLIDIVKAEEADLSDYTPGGQKTYHKTIKSEIKKLAKMAQENDSAYVRFITF